MPSIWQVINPEGEAGAVMGLGAPLMTGATKDALHQPMERGAYALATRDRKTVVKLLVLSKEEAGFDPEAIARNPIVAELNPEILNRIRATWTIGQATFESHDPNVYPALRFHLALVRRLGELTEAAIADPLSKRYHLPQELLRVGTSDTSVDVLDMVGFGTAHRPDGLHAFTLGLQKIALPELEITSLDPAISHLAGEFLLSVAQGVLRGNLLPSGTRLGSSAALFEVRQGGHDRGLWEGIDVMELLPPTHMTATDALEMWDQERRSML